MNKFLNLLFIILFYSCGTDNTTNPSSTNYYSDDQQFLDELIELNDITEDDLDDRITKVEVDSGSVSYYRVEKLYLGNMGLDSIPPSIAELENLNVLILTDNNLHFLTEVICDIYNGLDSLEVSNNDICTPNGHMLAIQLSINFNRFISRNRNDLRAIKLIFKHFLRNDIVLYKFY